MIFIELRLDHPLLREALRAVPEIRVEWVRNTGTESETEMVFWAEGGDFGRFETALEMDQTVTLLSSVTVNEHQLYRVELTGRGTESDLYPVLVEIGGIVMSATASSEGWHCRLGFPDRAGVDRFFAKAAEYDVEFEIHRLYELERVAPDPDFGLTDLQRETLLSALEAGYFDVPRQCDMQELADRLGVSDTAVSQRLRRGIRSLLENTVGAGSNHGISA